MHVMVRADVGAGVHQGRQYADLIGTRFSHKSSIQRLAWWCLIDSNRLWQHGSLIGIGCIPLDPQEDR